MSNVTDINQRDNNEDVIRHDYELLLSALNDTIGTPSGPQWIDLAMAKLDMSVRARILNEKNTYGFLKQIGWLIHLLHAKGRVVRNTALRLTMTDGAAFNRDDDYYDEPMISISNFDGSNSGDLYVIVKGNVFSGAVSKERILEDTIASANQNVKVELSLKKEITDLRYPPIRHIEDILDKVFAHFSRMGGVLKLEPEQGNFKITGMYVHSSDDEVTYIHQFTVGIPTDVYNIKHEGF